MFASSLGDGPPVIVPLACWCEEFDVLAEGRQVIRYDPRGRGRSSTVGPAQVSFENDIADLDAVRAAFGLEHAAVVGWSYFGGVAARYAMLYPERVSRLVLVSGTPVRGGEFLKAVQAEQAARLKAVDGPLMDEIARGTPFAPEIMRRYWDAFVLSRSGLSKPPWPGMRSRPFEHPNEHPERAFPLLTRAMQTLGDWDWRGEASRIRCPVLILDGAMDILPEQAAREWAEPIPGARTEILEGAGHFPAYEDPAGFFSILDGFLEKEGFRQPE